MCGRQVVVHGHAGLLYFRLDLSPNKCATIILFSMSVCLSFFLSRSATWPTSRCAESGGGGGGEFRVHPNQCQQLHASLFELC